ncbi:hypothetical protein HK098_005405 [Nowakowskiella sp. JEL0407]|nr:hypothetical protein HK098_005405 [Nowakowskiella sp. JEL0407]
MQTEETPKTPAIQADSAKIPPSKDLPEENPEKSHFPAPSSSKNEICAETPTSTLPPSVPSTSNNSPPPSPVPSQKTINPHHPQTFSPKSFILDSLAPETSLPASASDNINDTTSSSSTTTDDRQLKTVSTDYSIHSTTTTSTTSTSELPSLLRLKKQQNRVSTISYSSLNSSKHKSVGNSDSDVVVFDESSADDRPQSQLQNEFETDEELEQSFDAVNDTFEIDKSNDVEATPKPEHLELDAAVIAASVQSWENTVDDYVPPKQPRGRRKIKQTWKAEFLELSELEGYAVYEACLFIRSSVPWENLKYSLSTTTPEKQLAVTEAVLNKFVRAAVDRVLKGKVDNSSRKKSLVNIFQKKSRPEYFGRVEFHTALMSTIEEMFNEEWDNIANLVMKSGNLFTIIDHCTIRGMKNTNEDRVVCHSDLSEIFECNSNPVISAFSSLARSQVHRSSTLLRQSSDSFTNELPPPLLSSSTKPMQIRNQRSFPHLSSSTTGPICCIAVFDGHAGEVVADYASQQLVASLTSHPAFPKDIPTALKGAFLSVNKALTATLEREKHTTSSGSTCTIAVLICDILYYAWIGDSPAFIFLSNGECIPLITPHTAENAEEKLRAERAGGVFLSDGQTERLNGVSMVTRAFGDFQIKAMTAEPEVKAVKLDGVGKHRERYLVVCSDGVTEVLSEEEIWTSIKKTETKSLRAKVKSWVVMDAAAGLGATSPNGLTTGSSHGTLPSGMKRIENKTDDNTDYSNLSQLAVGAAEDLVNLANYKGSGDNISAIIVDLVAWKNGIQKITRKGSASHNTPFGFIADITRKSGDLAEKRKFVSSELRRDDFRASDDSLNGGGVERSNSSMGTKFKMFLKSGSSKNMGTKR